MKTIREVLEDFDQERGRLLPVDTLKLHYIWSILIFTSDGHFCNTYQKHLRMNCGCKWVFMKLAFVRGLQILKFVQNMGSDC